MGELLELYRNYLRLVARSLVGTPLRVNLDPSDLVQETFLKAHRDFIAIRGAKRAGIRGLAEADPGDQPGQPGQTLSPARRKITNVRSRWNNCSIARELQFHQCPRLVGISSPSWQGEPSASRQCFWPMHESSARRLSRGLHPAYSGTCASSPIIAVEMGRFSRRSANAVGAGSEAADPDEETTDER